MNRRRLATLLVVVMPLLTFPVSAALSGGGPPTGETDGATLVGVQGAGTGGKLARVGETGDVTIVNADAASYHDVSRLDSGNILASYVTADAADCGPYRHPCARTGVRILTPSGEVVYQWSFPVRDMRNSEVHDAEYLEERNEFLLVDMDRERVFTVDRETGEITWQWNASQQYEAPEDPTTVDWLHMNDVDAIAPGEYLVSVRNANQLVIVNRSCTCVREVINKDRDPTVMRGQHNPQWLGDGRVLVADSSNDRVVELARNNSTGNWEVVWTRGRAAGRQFAWPRDADRLPNGHTLITDTRNHRIVEIDENGDLVAVFRTPKLPYEADRIGVGEPVGGPYQSGKVTAPGNGEGHVPVFGRALIGLHHTVGVPAWMNGWHLVAVWLSLLGGTCSFVLSYGRD